MADIFNTFLQLIPITLAQSLIYAFVALGIMLPFRILSFPDLTSEGAFPLGGCVCGTLLAAGVHPFFAMLAALVAGFVAGCCTALIHLRFRINTLLAGILMITMLFSVDLRIMGRSNIPLFSFPNIFDTLWTGMNSSVWAKIAFLIVLVGAVIACLAAFFKTEIGTGVRAVGANVEMAEAQCIDVWKATIAGVGAASALSALGGSLLVQSQGYADVNIGFGVLINGLAALIIGEQVIGNRTVLRQVIAPVLGAVIYYQLVSFCLALGLPPSDLKLATGLFVLFMLGLPALRGQTGGMLKREKVRE